MKIRARVNPKQVRSFILASLSMLILSACNGSSNTVVPPYQVSSGDASAGKEESAPLPPLHAPTVSILRDRRLVWDKSGATLPIMGMGYRPNDPAMPGGLFCFSRDNAKEETNISESGFHLRVIRPEGRDSLFITVSGVHITRERYVSSLEWNEQDRAWMLTPKEKGGLGISLQELNEECGMGVVADLFGQYAMFGFEAAIEEGEEIPPKIDFYFENTPAGRTELMKAFQPYLNWSAHKVGESIGNVSPVLETHLDSDQKNNYAAVAIAYVQEAVKLAETNKKLRDGDDLRQFLLVDKAPAHD